MPSSITNASRCLGAATRACCSPSAATRPCCAHSDLCADGEKLHAAVECDGAVEFCGVLAAEIDTLGGVLRAVNAWGHANLAQVGVEAGE